ncbi:MAG: DUF4160 domain-containing protein [Gallionella sp.]
MPFVSIFFGIIIKMFHKEHNPPHFHAEYQGQRGMFDFSGEMVKGNITSRTAKSLIKQWAVLHQVELNENWDKAAQSKPLDRIAPLD